MTGFGMKVCFLDLEQGTCNTLLCYRTTYQHNERLGRWELSMTETDVRSIATSHHILERQLRPEAA